MNLNDFKDYLLIKLLLNITNMSSNINLSDYYTKISQMRNKILSKHQTNQTTNLKVSQISFSQNTNDIVANKYLSGNPLVEVNDNRRTINCRVKELDDINDKIKNMLAYKRSVQKKTQIERSVSIQKNDKVYQSKIKVLQNITQQPKRKFETIVDRGELQRNLRQQRKQKTYAIKDDKPNALNADRSAWNRIQFAISTNLPLKDDIKQIDFTDKPTKPSNGPIFEERALENYLKTPEKEKLVKLLLRQVELDRKLQDSKEKYEYQKQPTKEESLIAAFDKMKIKISKEQIQNWIKFYPEECNPFLPISPSTTLDSQQLAKRVIEAKQHWQNVLKQAISISNLEKQNFKISQIDLDEKGYISIEDLVCYLNINSSDAFLRNRDILSLFKRLKRYQGQSSVENKLRYETFLNFISK